ncbi:hypothetical protein L596_020815 [Steinernema carpocapsae]|nr:hypothetical protein L596_020815 [Steinernema carpocapsae]
MSLEHRFTSFDHWPELQGHFYQNNLIVISLATRNLPESENAGRLFLDFLRFYATEFDEANAVQITQSSPLSRESLGCVSRFIAIEGKPYNWQ